MENKKEKLKDMENRKRNFNICWIRFLEKDNNIIIWVKKYIVFIMCLCFKLLYN